MTDSEETKQAIEKVLGGDSEAFRFLVREHRLMLRSFLGSQLHHGDVMDDIAQEVFIKAFRKIDQYDPSRNFCAWLRGIARNQLLMHFRTVGRRKANELKFREEVFETIRHDLEHNFQQQTTDAIESLLRCINELPDRMRKVVRSGLDGVKAQAMAEELSTSVGAIYNVHYRANELLRECVRKEIG